MLQGDRLPLPYECPADLYNLMCYCWSYEPSNRPTFREVKSSLRFTLKQSLMIQLRIYRVFAFFEI